MKKRTGFLAIAACSAILLLLLSAGAGAQPQPAPPPPPSPEAVKVGENLYRLGQVLVDTRKREVTLRGWINMEEGLVEYLAVAAGGKLHESVLVLDARPTHLQVALILLGLEAKGDFEFQGDPRPPKGDPVEIWVEWKEKEQTRRVRAEQLIRDSKRNRAMEATPWIFTGSKLYEGVLLAEIAKSLIATFHDPAAILNNPLTGGVDDTVYYVNTEAIPKKGTAVVLTIKPLAGDKGRKGDPPKEEKGSFFEPFDGNELDLKVWKATREGDFRGSTIDIYDHRLRLRADTRGTRDETVKFHGVRTIERIDFAAGKRISLELDWNHQSNGSYLTAGLYLCPTVTEGNPEGERDWLKFEYIGVPPRKNARRLIAVKVGSQVRWLDTEGWPERREGRQIANQQIEIALDGQGLKVSENGREVYRLAPHGLTFSSGYLYLQMSSHSNYPPREVYFDNLQVRPAALSDGS